jgi:uncharacterized membrane protein
LGLLDSKCGAAHLDRSAGLSLYRPKPNCGRPREYLARRPSAAARDHHRHPTLWAIGLWALAHLVVNGDAKKRAGLELPWGSFELTTSVVPFLAIVQGRTHFDWAGIGSTQLFASLVLWAVLWFAHPYFIGASPATP